MCGNRVLAVSIGWSSLSPATTSFPLHGFLACGPVANLNDSSVGPSGSMLRSAPFEVIRYASIDYLVTDLYVVLVRVPRFHHGRSPASVV